jgi:hypothetical protein
MKIWGVFICHSRAGGNPGDCRVGAAQRNPPLALDGLHPSYFLPVDYVKELGVADE